MIEKKAVLAEGQARRARARKKGGAIAGAILVGNFLLAWLTTKATGTPGMTVSAITATSMAALGCHMASAWGIWGFMRGLRESWVEDARSDHALILMNLSERDEKRKLREGKESSLSREKS